jgi:hypothetical protein
MKKQTFSAVLLSAALLTTGFVSSCKDNDADLFSVLDRELSEQVTLRQALQEQVNDLDAKIKVLEGKKECLCEVSDAWKETLKSGSFDDAFKAYWAQEYANVVASQAAVNEALAIAKEARTLANNLQTQVTQNTNDIVSLTQKIDQANTLITEAKNAAAAAQSTADSALAAANAAQSTADSALTLANTTKTTLDGVVTDLTTLTNRVDVIEGKLGTVEGTLRGVADSARVAYATAFTAKAKAEALKLDVDALGNVVNVFGEQLDSLGNVVAEHDSILGNLNTTVSGLSTTVSGLNTTVGNHTTEINNLKTLLGATADTTSVINLSNALVDSITNVRDEAAANLNKAYEFAKQAAADSANQVKVDLTNSISEVKEDLKETIKNNADSIDHLADSIKANAVKIAKLQDALTDLTNVVANVQKDLSNLITGILIQGTDDPIFGYLALPFGIQTNILAAYYGAQWSDDDLSFPTVGSLNYISDDYFTAEDAALVGFNAETIISTDATIMNTNVGNAGKIYLTINPSTIDFTGQTLILESSAGNASPIQLSNIKKSDKELTFGYTRAGNNNGFYEADATLLSEGIASAKPNIQLSTFKTLAKDILNTKTFNLTNIVSTVYQSINGVLPRYGAKATWTNSEDKEVAVLSQYSIATTAIKPLSYSFLKDVNLGSSYLNKRLPLIDENAISNKIDDAVGNISFNFNIDTIKINVPDLTFNIKWEGIEFSQDGLQLEVSYEYKLPQYEYDEVNKELVTLPDSTKHTGTAYVDNIDDLYDKIETEVNDKVGALVDSISTFNGKIENFTSEINGIQESINTVLKSINGQLDTNVQDAIDQIKDNLNGLGSGYISTYNNVATRINSVLNRVTSAISNANSKLQPTMIYDAADGTSMQLSAAKAMPTVFNVSGSGEQVAELLATSYSAELLAPAYKKYVAVTNVYKDGKSAKDGDATCKAALAKANNPERFMNTVIDGTQRQVLLTTDSQYKGYTYEIAYAAVDYFGQISLRRYYVKVK